MTTTLDIGDRRLDWLPEFDDRSLGYKISARASGFSTKPARTRMWTKKRVLDQGQEGACTGFALVGCMLTTPKAWLGLTNTEAHLVYMEARRDDEYPGEDYEGSSVLGAMRAGVKLGLIAEYWWATTLEEIISGVSHYGAMEFGSDWLTGMDHPDEKGFVHFTGTRRGGHAYEVGGVNVHEEYFRLDNSWGEDGYGIKGSAKISFADVQKIIDSQGEFALPHKLRPHDIVFA